MNEKIKVNKTLLAGWATVVLILLLAYTLEFVKGERTLGYFIVFILFGGVPFLIAQLMYRVDRESAALKYVVAYGYAAFYLFVLLTGDTDASAREAAREAASTGYRVSVLGLGEDLVIVEDLSSEAVRLRLRAPREASLTWDGWGLVERAGGRVRTAIAWREARASASTRSSSLCRGSRLPDGRGVPHSSAVPGITRHGGVRRLAGHSPSALIPRSQRNRGASWNRNCA